MLLKPRAKPVCPKSSDDQVFTDPSCLVLITGPSQSGVGAQTAIFLAQGQPEHIILAGRNKSKIQPVVEEIQKINSEVIVSVVQLDLADFSSIHAAAEEIIEKVEKLDILINNAGGRCRPTQFDALVANERV